MLALGDPTDTNQQQQQEQQGLPVWASKLLAVGALVLVSVGGAALPFCLQRKAAAEEVGPLGAPLGVETQQEDGVAPPRPRWRHSWVHVMLVFLNCFACGEYCCCCCIIYCCCC